MVFKTIFGQKDAISLLERDLKNDSVAHAYLFSGSLGVGKTKTALQFAKAIACHNSGCGKCPVCHSFEQKIHPDFQFIEAQGNFISINQVRQLEHWVAFKAAQALRKVVMIGEIERLTEEAANALLKTLEEPQENVVFLCISSNPNTLLPTIISRCRHVKFKQISAASLISFLSKKDYEPTRIELATKLSQGVFGKALNLLENEDLWELRFRVLEILKGLLEKNADQISLFIELLLEDIKPFQKKKGELLSIQTDGLPNTALKLIKQQAKRYESAQRQDVLIQAIDFWWLWLRDIVVYSETGDKERLINSDYFDEIKKRCQNNEAAKSWYLLQQVSKIKEMIKNNIGAQLVLETTLMEALNN